MDKDKNLVLIVKSTVSKRKDNKTEKHIAQIAKIDGALLVFRISNTIFEADNLFEEIL